MQNSLSDRHWGNNRADRRKNTANAMQWPIGMGWMCEKTGFWAVFGEKRTQ